jgi:molybdopterin converting factor small subunit
MQNILFFGKLTDVTGNLKLASDIPENILTTHDLRLWLNTHFNTPHTFTHPSIRIALDGEIAHEPANINGATEIALMPPVGGG